MKTRIVQAVAQCVPARSFNQCAVSLDTHDFSCPGGHRQGKITQATEQVQNAVVGREFQQFHGSADHGPIHCGVYLYKIRWLKNHFNIEFRNFITQLQRLGLQAVNTIRAFWLQQHRDSTVAGKATQLFEIAITQRLQVAEYQRTAIVTTGHFKLRNTATGPPSNKSSRTNRRVAPRCVDPVHDIPACLPRIAHSVL